MKLSKISRMLVTAGLSLSSAAILAAPPTLPAPNPAGGGALGGNGLPTGTLTATGKTFTTAGALGNNAGVSGPGTGIFGTAHDFVSGTTGSFYDPAAGGPPPTTAGGLCTYCHTPHKASSTLLLWNHKYSSSTFQWDVASTTAGTALPSFSGSSYGGPSAKCLSCHDGTVAIGDVNWFGEAKQVLDTTKMDDTIFLITNSVTAGVGDLKGNHPVAIPYPLNGAPNVYNNIVTGANLATNDFDADPTANNMRLYSDVGGGIITGKVTPGKTGIECSTCHDPHNKAATEDLFLRGKLVGATKASGYICLQCHVK